MLKNQGKKIKFTNQVFQISNTDRQGVYMISWFDNNFNKFGSQWTGCRFEAISTKLWNQCEKRVLLGENHPERKLLILVGGKDRKLYKTQYIHTLKYFLHSAHIPQEIEITR